MQTNVIATLFGILSFSVLGMVGALAQERAVPSSMQEMQLSFAPIVRGAAPAVVNVYATQSRQEPRFRSPFMDDPFFRRFFGGPDRAPQRQRQSQSLGSGVIVEPSGIIITNNHVISGADNVRVAISDGREFNAEIVLRDEQTDLAVLKVDAPESSFPFLEFEDSDNLEVGDIVLAIGNPFGVGQTVTQGIISALARTRVGVTDFQSFIQTDAAINPGNSGGALIDMSGRLVGINTAIFSRSGGSNGIGFAVPANMVRVVAESALGGSSRVVRPWFGADLQQVSNDIADGLGLDRARGALIREVYPQGPADVAGLRVGDLILRIEDQEINDPRGFDFRYATRGVGGVTEITALRNGREIAFSVPLTTPPETVPRDQRLIDGQSPFSGLTVLNISPAVQAELSFDGLDNGVVIAAVEPRTWASRIGFRKGDVILAINGQDVNSTKELDALSRGRPMVWRFEIWRKGRVIRTAVNG